MIGDDMREQFFMSVVDVSSWLQICFDIFDTLNGKKRVTSQECSWGIVDQYILIKESRLFTMPFYCLFCLHKL